MLHIFVDPENIQEDTLTITGSDVNHIRNVLRMKIGEEISVSDGQGGKEYRFGIERYEEDAVICKLRFVKENDVELPVEVLLFQGLPKADKMDFIVQKAVEMGVTKIIPVSTKRSVVKLDGAKQEKKVRRWQTIAEAAAKQSRRSFVPEVLMPMKPEEAFEYAREHTDVRLIPYELQKDDGSTKQIFETLQPGSGVSIFIGPEGGFEVSEVESAREAGIRPISLGKRILRTETAAMVVMSWLIYHFEIG